ncbi:unnamed protein product [Boreogadus saida]
MRRDEVLTVTTKPNRPEALKTPHRTGEGGRADSKQWGWIAVDGTKRGHCLQCPQGARGLVSEGVMEPGGHSLRAGARGHSLRAGARGHSLRARAPGLRGVTVWGGSLDLKGNPEM